MHENFLPWLRLLFAGLPSRMSGILPRPIHVGIYDGKVDSRRVYLRLLLSASVRIIVSLLRTHSSSNGALKLRCR